MEDIVKRGGEEGSGEAGRQKQKQQQEHAATQVQRRRGTLGKPWVLF